MKINRKYRIKYFCLKIHFGENATEFGLVKIFDKLSNSISRKGDFKRKGVIVHFQLICTCRIISSQLSVPIQPK